MTPHQATETLTHAYLFSFFSEIVNWVNKKSGPPAKDLDSTDAAEAFVEKAEVSVIGFFESADSAEAKAFLAAAASNDDVPFGITTSKEVAAKYSVTAPGVALFKDFDEKRNNFDGDFSADEINTFVSANQLPLVVPFSQEAAPKIFGGAIKVHYLYFLDTETDEAESAIESFREVAAAVRGRALAITVNLEHDRVMGYFGITEDDLPTAVLVHMPDGGQMKKYLYDGEELEKEAMIDFAERYFAGSLKPFLKSADEPENNDEPVTVLVGKNFEKIALDTNKDVFVEFYAPWCGHCKSLAPKWEEVGEKFADLENVVIAKMVRESVRNYALVAVHLPCFVLLCRTPLPTRWTTPTSTCVASPPSSSSPPARAPAWWTTTVPARPRTSSSSSRRTPRATLVPSTTRPSCKQTEAYNSEAAQCLGYWCHRRMMVKGAGASAARKLGTTTTRTHVHRCTATLHPWWPRTPHRGLPQL